MANLWLFDIDGTLVDIRDVQIAATQKDFEAVLGMHVPADIILGTFGMSEIESLKSIFKAISMPHNNSLIEKIIKLHPLNFAKVLSTNGIKPLEGVVTVLTALQAHKEYLGVVTGNLEGPARLILERAGLKDFFSILSCDDGRSERKQIVQNAIHSAKKRKYNFNRAIVIGDTTRDIDAGKHVNAFTVAVATGTDSFAKLQDSNPDIVLLTLRHYKRIFTALR